MKDDRLASEFGEERRGRVSLIGFRGTGKSAVGRRLAQRLGWPWYDTDREVTRRAGRTIAELFAEQGATEADIKRKQMGAMCFFIFEGRFSYGLERRAVPLRATMRNFG